MTETTKLAERLDVWIEDLEHAEDAADLREVVDLILPEMRRSLAELTGGKEQR